MKKLLLVLTVLLILTSCGEIREIELQQVQDRNGIIYEVNQNKPFNGVVIIDRYSNNQIKEKYEYKKGKIVGAIFFRENGTKKTETKIEAGKRVDSIEYYETGEKREILKKIYDEKTMSEEIIKYYKNGNKESSSKYHKNESKESLEIKKYYENGNIKLEKNIDNEENVTIEYDLDGKRKNGEYKEEYSDAKYKNSYNLKKYKEGIIIELSKFENDKIVEKNIYDDRGKQVEYFHYIAGNLKWRKEFKKNEILHTFYNEDGTIQATKIEEL